MKKLVLILVLIIACIGLMACEKPNTSRIAVTVPTPPGDNDWKITGYCVLHCACVYGDLDRSDLNIEFPYIIRGYGHEIVWNSFDDIPKVDTPFPDAPPNFWLVKYEPFGDENEN